ncbi:right-handed parallel beta-helix repeat-containing protein [Hymenobacter armeniacus]|uniref:T9SS type A sorting domain-containing protein n=1 Tax=Hymenobacter armeniacus TaxID=2771358 RepID=A0ABR8JZ01_9BACT|nr:right-handed parallel beta-helix repeat-containing protein [Hymenobacter armeniacus]MBD2724662.1 T9SS type A sorting domain-containing protein [Hymenobacter armeniacus]
MSNSGNDANSGTSPAQAWRTPARVSAATFHPGDRVLFAGGQTFSGSLRVRPASHGTAAQPIVFRSYGIGGPAVIASDTAAGFYAYNNAGFELRNLTFVGAGRLVTKHSGVRFYNDSTNAHLQYLRIDSLDISGYRGVGLTIASWNGTSGYDNVRITNSQFHANGEAGLSSYSYFPLLGHRNWYVGNCKAYDNSGRPEITNTHSGNGIVLSGIDGAMVENCTAYHNGWLNGSRGGGPVGIWGWECNNLTIQYCESHHNEAGAARDGGGFDLDGGCTNSVMQYNYSHDNDGPGYLLCQFDWATAMHDLVVRYNVSQNDARKDDQGAIMMYSSGWAGGIVNVNIYNNTVYLDRPANGSTPSAVYIMSGDIAGTNLRNNILQTATGLPVVRTFTASGLRFEGNAYWSPTGALTLSWNGASFNNLTDWRTATTQETLANGTRLTGVCASPCFASATPGVALSTGSRLPNFTLGSSSPLLGSGLNLATEFNINPGTRDFYGANTPGAGSRGNIGASEARLALATRSGADKTNDATWCQVYPTVASSEIHVVAEKASAQPVEIQLVDVLGRSARTWSRPGNQLSATGLTLSVDGLAAGRYVLRVQSGTQTQHQTVLVGNE